VIVALFAVGVGGCEGAGGSVQELDPAEVQERLMPSELRAEQLSDRDGEGAEVEVLAWQSAAFATGPGDCDRDAAESGWVSHPAGGETRIAHGLGRAPLDVLVYLSFESGGCRAALASGDLARVISADGEQVAVENATGESFYMRLVLR